MTHHDASGDSSREVSVRLKLLDAQLVDSGDLPVGRVDDVDIELGGDVPRTGEPLARVEGPRIVALLVGQRHLGPRVEGLTGRALRRTAERLSHDPAAGRVRPQDVASWSGILKLRHDLAGVDLAPLEKWLSSRVVRRIPGADDEGL